MKNNIILIGYMGCGKSTIGSILAEKMGRRFLDTDSWIEEREGITISEIFASKGEAFFRDLETSCLKELLRKEETYIISVGGGLPVREENRLFLKELGNVVYLKAKPDTVYERIKDDTSRPLLQTKNPLQRIQEMMEDREEKYMDAAHWVISVDGKSVLEIADQIMDVGVSIEKQ